ncbi:uncharacterized protein LOC111340177 [Stylophora pistillata]|uniref:uncharacterized protein LOC111340177 n=1 Tax=Stylophora pistillata TaxID=50429 RepID=UPI000C056441|nr:uncharacterized protein LOC111340177 [Stylophora pistillata]
MKFVLVCRFLVLLGVVHYSESKPYFIQEPASPQSATEGDNITLSWSYNLDETFRQTSLQIWKVLANGYQNMSVIKYPNNNPQFNNEFGDRFHLQIMSENQTSVEITGIPRSDSGKYQYQITTSDFQLVTSSVELSVLYYHPVKTTMTTNLTDNTVVVSETFSITCSAQANPPAKYRFYEGNEYVDNAGNDAMITTSASEKVKMVNYSCIPFNVYGNGTKGEVAVTVYCKYLIE